MTEHSDSSTNTSASTPTSADSHDLQMTLIQKLQETSVSLDEANTDRDAIRAAIEVSNKDRALMRETLNDAIQSNKDIQKDNQFWMGWGGAAVTLATVGAGFMLDAWMKDMKLDQHVFDNGFVLKTCVNHQFPLCINGGFGATTYGAYTNMLSEYLKTKNIDGVGASPLISTGTIENQNRLSLKAHEMNLSLGQKDGEYLRRSTGEIDHITILREEPNIIECAFMPASGKFETLENVIDAVAIEAQKKRAGEPYTPIRIALPPKTGGSGMAGRNIITSTMDKDGYVLLEDIDNEKEALSAVEGKKADFSVIVSYPGGFEGQGVSGLVKDMFNMKTGNLLTLLPKTYENHLQDNVGQYRYLNVRVRPPALDKTKPETYIPAVKAFRAASYNMQAACTHMVVWGRDPDTVDRQEILPATIKTYHNTVSTAPAFGEAYNAMNGVTFRVLAEPTKPQAPAP